MASFTEILKMLLPGDLLLSRLVVPVIKDTSILLTGSHIAHNGTILNGNKVIDAINGSNIRILDSTYYIAEFPYIHIYRLDEELIENKDKEKILKKLTL
jgi:hypothetical protein